MLNPKFSIKLFTEKGSRRINNEKCIRGEIQIGKFKEEFDAPIDVWKVKDYYSQWKTGLERFLKGAKRTALITERREPKNSSICINWWLFYRSGKYVFVNNQIIPSYYMKRKFNFSNPYSHIGKLTRKSSEGQPISTWKLTQKSISEFYKKINRSTSEPKHIK